MNYLCFCSSGGLWLIFIEVTFITFAWYFDIQFRNIELQVMWSLGISMIFLAALIHLPYKIILLFSLTMIFGHNLFDNIHSEGNILWAIFHDQGLFNISDNKETKLNL